MPISEEPQEQKRKRPTLRHGIRYALIGLIFGFTGLGIAAYRMSVEAEPPPPARKKEISDVLSDTIKKTVDKFRPKENPAPQEAPAPVSAWPATKKLGLAASVCGFVGLVLGCVSWLVGEHRRWTWTALCVGIAALAWTHVVVAAAFAVAVGLILWFLSTM